MLCAVFSRPQELREHSILCSNHHERRRTIWQLRRRQPRRRLAKRRQRRKRDSSFTKGATPTTNHWRTRSKALVANLKRNGECLTSAPFLFFLDHNTVRFIIALVPAVNYSHLQVLATFSSGGNLGAGIR